MYLSSPQKPPKQIGGSSRSPEPNLRNTNVTRGPGTSHTFSTVWTTVKASFFCMDFFTGLGSSKISLISSSVRP